MKYHKIRGIEKTVCTAEQKIAYNIAFTLHVNFGDEFKKICKNGIEINIVEALDDLISMEVRNFRKSYSYNKLKKYDEDSIFCALRAGIREYLLNPFVASSYDEIGEAFPALYLA